MSSQFASSFEPLKFSPEVERLLAIQDDIRTKAAEIFSLYFDSLAGYEAVSNHLEEWKRNHEEGMKAIGIPMDEKTWTTLDQLLAAPPHGKDSGFDDFARAMSDYRARLLPSGRNTLLIGNYLLIALYQHWEDAWRCQIADALGLASKNEIKSDFWGDLRLIRHCLIHRSGMADDRVATESVKFKWFNEGDPIVIDRDKTTAIITGLYRFMYEDLFAYKG